jgi:GT2 family glycosyltransferase
VVTANAAFRRGVLERLGGFDPHLTRAQDVELGFRLAAGAPCGIAYSAGAVATHRHHSTQLAFFRQQLGWAYGAGLVGAKFEAMGGEPVKPPPGREIAQTARGLATVLVARIRRRGRTEWIEDAWFDLLRQLAWWIGARAGLRRGARIWNGGDPEGKAPNRS